jgi:hypothetical protein
LTLQHGCQDRDPGRKVAHRSPQLIATDHPSER